MFQLAQAAHRFRDIAVLKQANPREPGGACGKARFGVRQSDSSQRQYCKALRHWFCIVQRRRSARGAQRVDPDRRTSVCAFSKIGAKTAKFAP